MRIKERLPAADDGSEEPFVRLIGKGISFRYHGVTEQIDGIVGIDLTVTINVSILVDGIAGSVHRMTKEVDGVVGIDLVVAVHVAA